MTTFVQVDLGTTRVFGEVGARVGMLLGRYLDDPVLIGVVAEHVAVGWLQCRGRGTGSSSVEHWWNEYIDAIEAGVGGVDCADEDDLRRVWTAHARSLLPVMASDQAPIAIVPKTVGDRR